MTSASPSGSAPPRREGFVKISRRAYRTDSFWLENRTFSRWEAWEDLVQRATWQAEAPWTVPGGPLLTLRRGETPPLSINALLRAWGWSRQRVRRFLALCVDTGRIVPSQETTRGRTYLLTTYDLYQGAQGTDEPTPDTPERPKQGPEIPGESQGKGHRARTASEPTPRDAEDAQFERFWKAYPKRLGGDPRKAARLKWNTRRKEGVPADAMVAGAERYARFLTATHKIGTQYVKQAQFWLSPTFRGWEMPWDPPDEPMSSLGVPPSAIEY